MNPSADHDWHRPAQGTKDIPLGALVRDLATGRVGVLQDVTPYADRRDASGAWHVQVLAFLRLVGGGREWSTAPTMLRPEPDAGAS